MCAWGFFWGHDYKEKKIAKLRSLFFQSLLLVLGVKCMGKKQKQQLANQVDSQVAVSFFSVTVAIGCCGFECMDKKRSQLAIQVASLEPSAISGFLQRAAKFGQCPFAWYSRQPRARQPMFQAKRKMASGETPRIDPLGSFWIDCSWVIAPTLWLG